MKKFYYSLFAFGLLSTGVFAQESEGGLPWGLSYKQELSNLSIEKEVLPMPDYAKYKAEDLQDAINNASKPYRVSAMVQADLNLQNSGSFHYLKNGNLVWRLAVEVPGAQALDIYYNKFNLPSGVKMFVSNSNGQQVLGAYTGKNANQFNNFTHTEIAGNIAIIELNIDAKVNIDYIDFQVGQVGAGYRGYENLGSMYQVTFADPVDVALSSPCHVNANCPAGDGEVYVPAKNATVRINTGGGWCTGTLINNTGNKVDGSVCKPYLLTASHCDGDNSRSDAGFSSWKFDFNYQRVECEGSAAVAPYSTRTGANFVARSNYPSLPITSTGNSPLVADILLVELISKPLASANAYLSGWSRATNYTDEMEDYNFVGFHHPAGDFKKLSQSNFVSPNGRFNQTVIYATHWEFNFNIGGTEPGSSGSGIFDTEGYLMGDLSGGQGAPGAGCAPMSPNALYSKLSYAWENEFDQTSFPAHAGATSRLKEWLDPINTGDLKLPATKYDCSDFELDIEDVTSNSELKNIIIYPNPSTDGFVNLKTNFTVANDIKVEVYNIQGSKIYDYHFNKLLNDNIRLDFSDLNSGVYFISIESSSNKFVHKISILK